LRNLSPLSLGSRDLRGASSREPERLPRSSHPVRFRNSSEAAERRSRCGSVRGRPVLTSHLSRGAAPQVGQRMASICLGLSSFFIAESMLPQSVAQEWSILTTFVNLRCGQGRNFAQINSEQPLTPFDERLAPTCVWGALLLQNALFREASEVCQISTATPALPERVSSRWAALTS
jgi:hypothetical protein